MRKLLRELKREVPGATIEITGNSHYRLRLPNGKSVIVSNTASDRNFMRHTIADVRRQLKENPERRSP